MWLLKAIGGIHGQYEFTFALEQKKIYSIGRDKSCDVRFESKKVRMKEGTVEVGDWDPANRTKPPSLRYKLEAKKSRTYPPYSTVLLQDPSNLGSGELTDYYVDKLAEGGQGCYLENQGMGIWYADDAWFTTIWKDIYFVYPGMKDETDNTREVLNANCVSYTPAFDLASMPTHVLSPTFKANPENNYAVCFAIRILKPAFLHAFLTRIQACWKKVADSQDSFSEPDVEDDRWLPELDSSLPGVRADVRYWLPDERRKELFKGWRLLGLKAKISPAERRYLTAMGAEYTDIDITSQPLLSAHDFETRLAPWLAEVDASTGRDNAVVVYFPKVKEDTIKAGKDWTTVVLATCQRLGVAVASGSILWSAVKYGGVRTYLQEAATNLKEPGQRAPVPVTQIAAAAAAAVEPPEATPAVEPRRTTRGTAVKSTSPEKAVPVEPSSAMAPASSGVVAQEDQVVIGETTEPAPSGRKPLRRRAGRPLNVYPDSVATLDQGGIGSEENSQEPMAIDGPVPEQGSSGRSFPSQSFIPDSIAPSMSQAAPPSSGRARLKRRAGGIGAQPSSSLVIDYTIPESSDIQNQEIPEEIRQVYEDAVRETGTSRGGRTAVAGPSRRQRYASVESRGGSETPAPADVEMIGVEEQDLDIVQQTLRKAARAKRGLDTTSSQTLMPPPAPTGTNKTRLRTRSPTEEPEPLEEVTSRPPPSKKAKMTPSKTKAKAKARGQAGASSPSKTGAATGTGIVILPPTQDTAFLQAIAKSKKTIDDLDKEFNQLRIPKPTTSTSTGTGGKSTVGPGEATTMVVNQSVYDAQHGHPNWGLVADFDDDLRGNFIEIVRMDLYRKDKDKDKGQEQERASGGPNFKKFKKKDIVRRAPVQMVLSGPTLHDPEMGEPYWPTQARKAKTSTQPTFTQGGSVGYDNDEDDDGDIPLLPRSRRRLLDPKKGDEDFDDSPPVVATGRGGRGNRVGAGADADALASQLQTQSQSQKAKVGSRPTRRAGREQSFASEVSSAAPEISTASGSRSRSGRSGGAATTKGRGGGGKTDNDAILIEESEDEIAENLFPSRQYTSASTSTAPGRRRQATTASGTTAPTAPTASGRAGGDEATASATASTRGGTGRRRLLPADDDDDGDGDVVFKSLAKKRRM